MLNVKSTTTRPIFNPQYSSYRYEIGTATPAPAAREPHRFKDFYLPEGAAAIPIPAAEYPFEAVIARNRIEWIALATIGADEWLMMPNRGRHGVPGRLAEMGEAVLLPLDGLAVDLLNAEAGGNIPFPSLDSF